MKTLGGWLLFLGAVGSLYFFLAFDTTVEVPTQTILGQSFGGGRVNNIGLMSDRSNGIIICLGLALVGVVLMVAGGRQETPATSTVASGGLQNPTNMQGWHPFFRAIATGDLAQLTSLLDTGTNISLVDTNGNSGLHYAALYDQPGAAAILLKRGASMAVMNKEGSTALQLATQKNARNTIAILNSASQS